MLTAVPMTAGVACAGGAPPPHGEGAQSREKKPLRSTNVCLLETQRHGPAHVAVDLPGICL
eukprot:7972220-Pyramimonas_sp.AAC.1